MTRAALELIGISIALAIVFSALRWLGNNAARIRREIHERITEQRPDIPIGGKP